MEWQKQSSPTCRRRVIHSTTLSDVLGVDALERLEVQLEARCECVDEGDGGGWKSVDRDPGEEPLRGELYCLKSENNDFIVKFLRRSSYVVLHSRSPPDNDVMFLLEYPQVTLSSAGKNTRNLEETQKQTPFHPVCFLKSRRADRWSSIESCLLLY